MDAPLCRGLALQHTPVLTQPASFTDRPCPVPMQIFDFLISPNKLVCSLRMRSGGGLLFLSPSLVQLNILTLFSLTGLVSTSQHSAFQGTDYTNAVDPFHHYSRKVTKMTVPDPGTGWPRGTQVELGMVKKKGGKQTQSWYLGSGHP